MKTVVMMMAWKIKREDERNLFSECLRLAWKQVKESMKYRGIIPTRKQLGAIYAAYKKGYVNVEYDVIDRMYLIVSMHERAVYMEENDLMEEKCYNIGRCVEALFDGNYDYVSEELPKAV